MKGISKIEIGKKAEVVANQQPDINRYGTDTTQGNKETRKTCVSGFSMEAYRQNGGDVQVCGGTTVIPYFYDR